MCRVLACGSRDYTDRAFLKTILTEAIRECDHLEFMIIQGEAPGADSMARDWARDHAVKTEAYPADWSRYGKAAGPIRNKQMITEGKPTRVIAFTNKVLGESRGTRNMVDQAVTSHIPVEVWKGHRKIEVVSLPEV
jgi:hypothetical protein